MSPQLNRVLRELAEQAPAPQADLAGRVITRARRRRRTRLIATPVAAAGAAAAVVAGVMLIPGERTESAPPASPLITRSGETLNAGRLPGPMPARNVAPIRFAFLDWCGQKGGPNVAPPKGDCGQWRLVDSSWKQWRLADGVGTYRTGTGNTMNGSAPLEISPDGRRVAYYQASRERFVVRELASGRVIPVALPMPLAELHKTYHFLVFSGDGLRLVLTSGEPGAEKSVLADTTTGAVTALPDAPVAGLGHDASTIVLAEGGYNPTGLALAGPDGKVRSRVRLDPRVDLSGAGGTNLLSPDGRTLFTTNKRHDRIMLLDARTGKVTRTLPARLSGGAVYGIRGWAGPSKVFTLKEVSGRNGPPGSATAPARQQVPVTASRAVIVDLNTGKFESLGTFKLRTYRAAQMTGGYVS
ncbi:hypothetical protein [Actinomadura hibisca]|uniref:hypothetical protein n=1 Tax=Actinomadura hibisca TaxID=68565 RepID=UPI0008336B77|nr:hypothetical protein [Actinomadura hibisca]